MMGYLPNRQSQEAIHDATLQQCKLWVNNSSTLWKRQRQGNWFCHFNSFVKASLVLLMTGDSLSPHYLKVNLAEVICYMTFSMDG